MPESNPTIKKFAEAVVERAQRNLGATRTVKGKRRRAVASDNLRKNLTFKIKQTDRSVVIIFGAKGKADNYARYVEEGREAGKRQPPVEPILNWMKIKPIRIRDARTGRVTRATENQKKGVAFAIARKIGRDGIPPVHYFKDAIKDTREEMEYELKAAIIKRLINRKFK